MKNDKKHNAKNSFVNADDNVHVSDTGSKLVQIGLKDVTKVDLEIRKNKEKKVDVHVIGSANHELMKSRMLTKFLDASMNEIELPFIGKTSDRLSDVLNKKYDSADKVAEVIQSVITQMTKSYHMSVQEREKYTAAAVNSLNETLALSDEDKASLMKEINFILKDGLVKNFRDNIGRNIAIPEASTMAELAETLSTTISEAVNKGSRFVDVEKLVKIVAHYSVIEKRAETATSDFDRRSLHEELAKLTKDLASDPTIALIVRNRIEFSMNASSGVIKVTMGKFAELMNMPLVNFEVLDNSTATKILKFSVPRIKNSSTVTDFEYIRLESFIAYVQQVMGAVNATTFSADMLSRVFAQDGSSNSSVNFFNGENYKDVISSDLKTLKEMHSMLFEMKVLELLSSSFNVIPSSHSLSLSKISQSINAKLSLDEVEPTVLALDSIKNAYLSSLKDLVSLSALGLSVPSAYDINEIEKKIVSDVMFRGYLSSDHAAIYTNMIDEVVRNYKTRNASMLNFKPIVNSRWGLGRITVKNGESMALVNRSLMYHVGADIEESVENVNNDGSLSNEELLCLLTGEAGTFRTVPYLSYGYSYGSKDLDEYVSLTQLTDLQSIKSKSDSLGIKSLANAEVVMIKRHQSAAITQYFKDENIREEVAWVGKLKKELVMIPDEVFHVKVLDLKNNSMRSKRVNSPFISITPTIMTGLVNDDVINIVSNDKHPVLHVFNTWPCLETFTNVVADLSHHKLLHSLLPSDEDRRAIERSMAIEGSPTISPEELKVLETILKNVKGGSSNVTVKDKENGNSNSNGGKSGGTEITDDENDK